MNRARAGGARLVDSQVEGEREPPLLDLTVGGLLDRRVARSPDDLALVVRHQGVRWTWAEFGRRVEALARGLVDAGLQPGERVGVWAANCAEWALVQFATARAGLILVNINPAYRTEELAYALGKVGCAALFTASAYKGGDYLAMVAAVRPRLPMLRLVVAFGEGGGDLPFEALAAGGRSALPQDLRPSDAVNIQFTSGTTGFPKGATLSHRNIVNNGYMVGRRIALSGADRVCIPVPLYHCFGMVMGNLACVAHGAAMVYPSDGFDPLATLSAVAEARCTALYGVPTMFIALLNHPDFGRFDLSSLRTGIMAGAPCPVPVMRQVIDRMHMSDVTIAYGMTETSPVSFQTAPDDPLERKVETVGRIQPHLQAKVVDAFGAVVACGQPGELLTRGYSLMLGYWDGPAETAAAIDADGWMHTGDLASLDEEGYCRIVGRIKDMVIRGGENIYPREIEEFLLTLEAVADVQVVGVPDERFGEELCAWIVLRPGATLEEADVRAYCRGRIAHYKVPRHIRFVESFPMTVTGKVQKFAIREAMIGQLKEA
jgi:fatty-acyl-CoA synthase